MHFLRVIGWDWVELPNNATKFPSDEDIKNVIHTIKSFKNHTKKYEPQFGCRFDYKYKSEEFLWTSI